MSSTFEPVEATIWFLQQRIQRYNRLNPHLNVYPLSIRLLILCSSRASIQPSHPSKGSLSYPHHTVDNTSMLSLLSLALPPLILTRDRKRPLAITYHRLYGAYTQPVSSPITPLLSITSTSSSLTIAYIISLSVIPAWSLVTSPVLLTVLCPRYYGTGKGMCCDSAGFYFPV